MPSSSSAGGFAFVNSSYRCLSCLSSTLENSEVSSSSDLTIGTDLALPYLQQRGVSFGSKSRVQNNDIRNKQLLVMIRD